MGKRKTGLVIVREPNGRLSRASETAIGAQSPGEVRRLRDAALKGMADPRWGTEIGRLYLAGKIDEVMFEAGRRWGRLVESYYRATDTPSPNPKAMNFAGGGRTLHPDPDSPAGQMQAESDQAVVQDMREAHAVLMAAGMAAERLVRSTCEHGVMVCGDWELKLLSTGLAWLAQHWGLTGTGKNVR